MHILAIEQENYSKALENSLLYIAEYSLCYLCACKESYSIRSRGGEQMQGHNYRHSTAKTQSTDRLAPRMARDQLGHY